MAVVDPEECNSAHAKLIMDVGMKFSVAASPEFNDVINSLNPEYSLPSAAATVRRCISFYMNEKEKLKKCFESLNRCVSITMGYWSDIYTRDYVCFTAHYIDNDWKMQKKIINFKLVPFMDPDLSKTLSSWLSGWKIKKLFSMALEDSLTKIVTPLQIKNMSDKFVKPGNELHCMPCHADVLKVLVKEGLDHTKSSYESIHNVLVNLRAYDIEPKFHEMAKEFGVDIKKHLYLDFPMLWHSTYLMLENTLRYQEVFDRFDFEKFEYIVKPTEDDWTKVGGLCKFLKLYYRAALLFSDTRSTADMYFFENWKICVHLKRESKSPDPFISGLAKKMQEIFDEHWNSCFVMLAIATIFNPRHKMPMVEFCLEKLYGSGSADAYIKRVRDGIQKLYDDYDDTLPSDDMDTESFSSNGDHDQFDDTFTQDYDEFLEKYYQTRPPKSELEVYLEEKVNPTEDNTLSFWKLNESRFPKLAMLARDVLAMPIVSVASESVFHIGNKVLLERYSNMGDFSLEIKICLQNWFQGPNSWQGTVLDGGVSFDEKDYEEDEEEVEDDYGVDRDKDDDGDDDNDGYKGEDDGDDDDEDEYEDEEEGSVGNQRGASVKKRKFP